MGEYYRLICFMNILLSYVLPDLIQVNSCSVRNFNSLGSAWLSY